MLAVLTVALLAILALGFHVFSAAPERPANRAFAAFAWAMSLWIVNDLAFFGFHGPDEDGRAWSEAAFLVALAMQVAFLRFAWVFPEPRPVPRGRALAILAPLAVVVPLVLAGRATGPVGFRGGRFHLELRPETFAVGLYNDALFAVGLALLLRKRRSATGLVRRQIDAVVASQVGTGILATLAVNVLPLVGVTALLPYASVAILAGTLAHAYAILSFHFLAPASVLDRVRLFPVTAKLALAGAGGTLATVAAVLGVARAAIGPLAAPDGGASPWARATVFGLAAASVPAMALIYLAQRIVARPLRRLTEAALEVADGRPGVRAPAGGGDEVAVLAGAFNAMVERLERDLAAQRETAEGLLRTERLATAGALAAGVAHEVNNPLAAVSSLVQLARGKVDDARAREDLDAALAEIDRISTALRDLMELARPRAAARRSCEVNAIASAAIRILRYDKRFRGIAIEERLAAGLPAIEADPDRIQQVLVNLLLNARDALDGILAPRIAVETRSRVNGGSPDGGAIEVEVSDNGRGISQDDLARVFEPFFTTKRDGAGTGLGLSVCRSIAREHGGEVSLESEAGRGTRVVVRLAVGTGPGAR